MDWIYFETNSLPNFAPIKINTERCVVRFGMAESRWPLPGMLPAPGAPSTGWPRGGRLFWSSRRSGCAEHGQTGLTSGSLGGAEPSCMVKKMHLKLQASLPVCLRDEQMVVFP